MKIFYYMGENAHNNSGFSWKIWKIERRNKTVTVWWGPAKIVRHRPKATGRLQQRSWSFRSEDAARIDEQERIAEKLSGRYKRMKPGKQ